MPKITDIVKKEIENLAATLPPIKMAGLVKVKGIKILTDDKYKAIRTDKIKPNEEYVVREGGTLELVSHKRRMMKLFHQFGTAGVREYVYKIRKDEADEAKREAEKSTAQKIVEKSFLNSFFKWFKEIWARVKWNLKLKI